MRAFRQLIALALGAAASASASAQVVINEAVVSHTGTDNTEFVELFGAPGTSLAGLSLIAVESDAAPGNTGGIDRRVDFGAADAVGANGFFLLGNPVGLAANYGVAPNATLPNDAFENSSLTLALVQTASLSGTTATGTELVLDAVGISDGGASDTFFFSAPVVGPDGTFFPAGVRRSADGVDTDTPADFALAVFNLGPGNTPSSGAGVVPPTAATIMQIQGSGSASPLAGARVETSGVVVADFQSASRLNGFFLQDPLGDADASTSDGLFVFAPGAPDVSVGDLVTVVGTVAEQLANTRIQGVTSVAVTGSVPALAPTPIALPETAQGALERYEGMLVEIASELTISQSFFLGRYGQLTLSGPNDAGVPGRLFQPTNVFAPQSAGALALADENARRLLVLDDGQDVNALGDNPNPVPYLGAAPGIPLRAGWTLPSVTGVLDQGRINSASTPAVDYRLHPTLAPAFVATAPRPAAPPLVPGNLRVATFNVLNYFATLDGGAFLCGPSGGLECRGADNAAEFARQRAKIIEAMRQLDADVLGLMEIENDASAALGDLVAGLNAATAPGTYAFVDTGTIGSDAIKVALLYKPARVSLHGVPRVLTSAIDARTIDTKNRPPLAQTFRERATGELFSVVVNHFKSKGSDCNVASAPGELVDPDTGDGQGNCNLTRTSVANALRDWLATDPTGSGDPDVLVIGDLNAYALEDPVRAFTDAGWVDLEHAARAGAEKSFTFDGLAGALDHALANPALTPQVRGVATWAINDDEPAVRDYNTEFNPAGYYAADAFRSSDHDPLVVGLGLCVDRSDLAALTLAMRSAPTTARYDLDGDGRVTIADARSLALRFTNPGGAACP